MTYTGTLEALAEQQRLSLQNSKEIIKIQCQLIELHETKIVELCQYLKIANENFETVLNQYKQDILGKYL